jgi:2-phospho-L-lactate guanylyltransferase
VLAALIATPGIGEVLIVSDEPGIAALTSGLRTTCVLDAMVNGAAGLNAVVTGAARHLTAQGATAMLVVPGDLPLLETNDIARFIAAWRHLAGPCRVALAPSYDGGTNLLLTTLPSALTFSYGPGSFAAHARQAAMCGRALAVISLPGAAADIDTPDDLQALARQPRRGRHTATFLHAGAALHQRNAKVLA